MTATTEHGALCVEVTSNDKLLRVVGGRYIGWYVLCTRTSDQLAHYQHEPGMDAFVALQRYLRERDE